MSDPTPPGPRAAALPDPAFTSDRVALYHGDAVELLPRVPEASIDALVSDPPSTPSALTGSGSCIATART